MPDLDWLPVSSVAEATLGILSQRQCYRFIASGDLSSVTINARRCVCRSELVALIDRLAAKPNLPRRRPPPKPAAAA